jgi:hypothetical protein
MPEEEQPTNDSPINFPDVPTNSTGQATAIPANMFPDIPTNDLGNRSYKSEPLSTRYPDISTNDRGIDSE